MKLIFALLILVLPLSSFAVRWVERGNGGFVLQCAGTATQTYDLYEAQERFGHLDQEKTESLSARMEYLLSKLAKKDPTRASLYLDWYSTFFQDAKFLDNKDLVPVPDIGFGSKPKNCFFELAIFQRKPDAFGKQRYTISRDLWNELDVMNQAALIMHELIYREAIGFDEAHTTSESSRYLNALLNAPEFSTLSDKDYLEILQTIGFQTADYAGFSISLGQEVAGKWIPYKLNYYANGNLKSVSLNSNVPTHPPKMTFLDGQCITPDSDVFFFENGSVSNVILINVSQHCKRSVVAYTKNQSHIAIANHSWFLNEAGYLTKTIGTLSDNPNRGWADFMIAGINFRYQNGFDTLMQFNEQGDLFRIHLISALKACRASTPNTVDLVYDVNNDDGLWLNVESIQSQVKALPLCNPRKVRTYFW